MNLFMDDFYTIGQPLERIIQRKIEMSSASKKGKCGESVSKGRTSHVQPSQESSFLAFLASNLSFLQ
jgi:hypothetical protein